MKLLSHLDEISASQELLIKCTGVKFEEELCTYLSVWLDLTIYWTLGNFLKPLATISLPKSPTFLGNFCKDVKIYHFSNEIIIGQLL